MAGALLVPDLFFCDFLSSPSLSLSDWTLVDVSVFGLRVQHFGFHDSTLACVLSHTRLGSSEESGLQR